MEDEQAKRDSSPFGGGTSGGGGAGGTWRRAERGEGSSSFGGGSFGGGGASGTWNTAALSAIRMIPSVTADDGGLLVMTIDQYRLGADSPPDHLTIGINGRPYDAVDMWSTIQGGTATLHYAVACRMEPATGWWLSPVVVRVEHEPGGAVPLVLMEDVPSPKLECEIEFYTCPPDCKSSIFHTKCYVCFRIKGCKITLGG